MLKRLSHWSRQLKPGYFKLFLTLAELTEDDEHHSVTIAARELCNLADIALSTFPQALAALEERNLVTVRHGGNRRQNAYQVIFFHTICVSKFDTQNGSRRTENRDTAYLFSRHSVPNFDTPPIEKSALARAAAASDLNPSILSLIDHVCCAKAKNYDGETLARFRRWMWGYMAKCGQNAAGDKWAETGQKPPQPTDDQVAQLLSVADERSITRMLELLLHENHEPMSYFWFVAVALQRIHGITVETRKKAQAILVDVKRQAKQSKLDAGELPDKQYAEQLTMELLANAKKMG